MKILCQNRRAEFDYFVEDRLEVGVSLLGTEVKSLRHGSGNISNSHVGVDRHGFAIHSFSISQHKYTNQNFSHEVDRVKRLLAHRREIIKWSDKVKSKGLTIVPTKVYLNNKGRIKIELILAKGKKLHDKRQSIKEKDMKREERMEKPNW